MATTTWPRRAVAALIMCLPMLAAGERLLAEAPDGWQRSYVINLPRFRLVEFEPPGAPVTPDGSWRERLALEASALAPGFDPLQLFAVIDAEQDAACADYRSESVFAGIEFGYPTAIKLLTCPRAPRDDGQILLVKVIQGDSHTYTLTRTWRVAAFTDAEAPLDPNAVGAWAQTLRRFRLCSDDAPADSPRACPAAAASGTAPEAGTQPGPGAGT